MIKLPEITGGMIRWLVYLVAFVVEAPIWWEAPSHKGDLLLISSAPAIGFVAAAAGSAWETFVKNARRSHKPTRPLPPPHPPSRAWDERNSALTISRTSALSSEDLAP
jgi:hypothetical protein